MSKIQLILLGHFECLLSSGQRISLSMRKAEMLLAYLALAPGIRHPRERLINLLWSDRGEEQARNSLRQCLSAIKKSLGNAADLVLLVDRTTVTLKPELVDVDALEFERLATEGDFESLSTAVDLYRGEFLEGILTREVAGQEWLDSERARFKRQFIEILTNLAETQLVSHDFATAVRSTERLVRQDPLGESGWRLLMRAYSDNSDRSHALHAFKRCQQALLSELDVEPETATVELRDQIAAGETRPAPTLNNGSGGKSPVPATPTKHSLEESPTGSQSSTDHSIAVLPFDNLSGDPEQEYFSDGITDSIILNLSLFPGLQVKSRNSSFAFKQQIKSLGEISEELSVDYIVEGSIRKSAQSIRITVQLIEAASGNQVWGKRYDAEIDDLFHLEEDLSRTIAATVTGQIESDLQRIALAKGAAHQQSYDLLLSGAYHVHRFNPQDNLIAIEKLTQCLAQDPENVRAHVHLYGCYLMNYLERWVEDYEASFKLAGEHIHTALAQEPDSGEVRVFYAEYLIFCEELDQAEQHLNKALEMNPNNPDALTTMTLILNLRGEFEAALGLGKKTYLLDPYQPWIEWELTISHYLCGRYQEVLQIIENTRTSPAFTRVFCVTANIKLGRLESAQQAFQTFLQECRHSMASLPETLDDWYRYIRDNYPFRDESLNQDMIDCLVQAGLKDETDPHPTQSQSDDHSIAVLPFDNLSGDSAQEYFSDGITESVILNLSLFPGLNVKSRNSSFAFKQQIKNPGEISRELGVDYIVEGSIRKTDDRIRVTVQLVEATSDNQVWGKRYDAEIENLFDLEEELSRTIAATVTGQIESDLQRIALAKGATDLQAYDLLLNGTYHLKLGDRENVAIAIEKFNQCLSKDPKNARVHANLFSCHDLNVIDRWTDDVEHSRELAAEHIRKAVSLDSDLGLVQVAYADHLIFTHQFDEAERQLKRAMDTNPNDTEAIAMLAVSLSIQGKAEAALEQAEHALKLDPYHAWVKWIKAESQYFCGRYQDCLATIADTGNAPGFIQIYNVAANVMLDRTQEAREALTEFLQFCREKMLSMPRTIEEWHEYYRDNAPFTDPAMNEEIIDSLVKLGLEEELSTPTAPGAGNELPSILVLPFSNLSGDPEQEYFSEGITDSIIVSLSSFSGLNVKSRHTSIAFKDSPKSIDEIGTELGVQYIVEGSIRKLGENVRITVQLGDTGSGNQVWGKRYDSPLASLFTLEEELVQTIAGTVSGRIEHETRASSMQKPAKDLRSYDYLMRGTHHLEKFNADDSKIGKEQLAKCLEIDPRNAEAHAQLAVAHSLDLFENWTDDRQRSINACNHHLQQAIQLEPENAYTHAYLAEHQLFTRDFKLGLFHADRSIELNPTLPDGYSNKSYLLAITGQIDAALKNADISMQIDPYSYYMGWNAGEVYRMAGQYQRAVDTFRSIPHMSPSVHAETSACLVGLGRLDEARAEMNKFHQLAQQQMVHYPQTETAWRQYWYEVTPYEHDEDFEVFYDQLLQAGLCDGLETSPDDLPSVAVLPFENMSGDPEQEYFSDGITASIILSLGLFDGLAVKSQNSSFAFRSSGKSSEEIADELNATYLVEGSIRKSANKVRISVQLIESASGNQVWGKQYDAELEDILELEQELSQTIAGTISGRIGHTLQQSAVRKAAKNLQSYDYLLRGLYYFGKFTARDFVRAKQEIEKCLEIDPDNSTAHTNLGMINWVEILEGWTDDQTNSESRTRFHLEAAIEIEPDNALAHSYFGEYLFFKRNYEQSEFHVDKAIELNPTAAEGYLVKADLLGLTRRIDEAIPYADRCLQLDPHSVGAGWSAGGVYQGAGQFEKAIKTYRSIPHPPASIHASIAACFSNLGLAEEARQEMKRYQELAKREMSNYPMDESAWRHLWRIPLAYQYEEDFEAAFDQLVQAGLLEDLTASSDDTPSIAVLPFENMSGDPEQEHFADGITTDIIATLSKFKHMRTVARYSILQYRDQKTSIADIAEQQKVRYILEGSVRKSGEHIRVSAQLIDAQNDQVCWSERFDRDLDALFVVQDEITQSIALAMKVQFDDGEMALHRSKGATSIRAWELTLAAVDLQETYIRQNILDARAMTNEAILLDPEYAYAWITLGWSYWQEAYSGWSDSIEELIEEAVKANQHAMSLDPNYGEAWSQAGMNHQMKHEPEEAIAACLRAVEFEPGSAEVHALTAFAYLAKGDHEEARKYDHNVLNLCPIRPNWYYLVSGGIEKKCGNLDLAIELFQQGLNVEPDAPLCRFYLIDALMEKGDEKRAQQFADEIRALDKSVTGKGLVHSNSYCAKERQRFHDNLAKFDLV